MRTRKNVLATERLLTAPRRVFGLAPPFILTRDRGFSPLAAAIEPRYRRACVRPRFGLQPALTLKTPLERDPWSGAGWPKYVSTAACGDTPRRTILHDGEFCTEPRMLPL